METLRELIALGFSPMVALVIAGVIVLWLALCGIVAFMWRYFVAERKERDALRDSWKAEVDGRLKLAETKNEECDKDRVRLHDNVRDLTDRVRRFERCGSKTCPMRLPR